MSRTISANSLFTVENFDSLPDSARADFGAVQRLTGKSRPTVYRWVKAGILPKPAKTPTGSVSWKVGDVRLALAVMDRGATK